MVSKMYNNYCFPSQVQILKNQVQEKDKIIEHLEVNSKLFHLVENWVIFRLNWIRSHSV